MHPALGSSGGTLRTLPRDVSSTRSRILLGAPRCSLKMLRNHPNPPACNKHAVGWDPAAEAVGINPKAAAGRRPATDTALLLPAGAGPPSPPVLRPRTDGSQGTRRRRSASGLG